MSTTDTNLSRAQMEDLLQSGEILPVFQPIISSETYKVYGYEVLGRVDKETGDLQSLGPFFLWKPKSEEDRIYHLKRKREINALIKEKAFQQFAGLKQDVKLFINVSPSSMKDHIENRSNSTPGTIELVRKYGIDPSKIVVEITEEILDKTNPETLRPLIDMYRKEGFQIAVDDLGSEASNLDRVGLYHPDIIKVDLQLLRRSIYSRNFQEILYTLSKLGESIGSSILFEGVEKESELHKAIESGARFFQGYYFHKPEKKFIDPDLLKVPLRNSFLSFHTQKIGKIEKYVYWEKRLKEQLSNLEFSIKTKNDIWEVDPKTLSDFKKYFFRLYITDGEGFQVSPNYQVTPEMHVSIDKTQIGKNWAWRPYFYEHILQSKVSDSTWVVSDVYQDVSENMMLRTVSRVLGGGLILFLDIIAEPFML